MHRSSDLQLKVLRIAHGHEQLKIAFKDLKSQIRAGLLEAEDVFASLAVPLMKLVGMKTVEMSEEGRFSSIIFNNTDSAHPFCRDWPRNRDTSEKVSGSSALAIRRADMNQRTDGFENLLAKGTQLCKELMHKQQLQLMQLVQLLQQIEIQVNSSQDDILQTLADHRSFLKRLFQKAVNYVYTIHRSATNGMSPDTVELLKCTFEHFGSTLGLVETGVENLITNLADKMCYPMAKYVKCQKAELVAGTCQSLLAMMEDMEKVVRLELEEAGKSRLEALNKLRFQSLELEEARKKVKAVDKSRLEALNKLRFQSQELDEARKSRLEALNKLKESESKLKEIKEWQSSTLEAHIQSRERPVPEKSMKDDTILWEVLKKKRKMLVPDSPIGATDLLGIGTNSRNLKVARVIPPRKSKQTSNNQSALLSPSTPRMDHFWIPLGSSPSTTIPQLHADKCRYFWSK